MEKYYVELVEKSKKKQKLIELGILAMTRADEVYIDDLRSAIEVLDDEKRVQKLAEQSLEELRAAENSKDRAKRILGLDSKQGDVNEQNI